MPNYQPRDKTCNEKEFCSRTMNMKESNMLPFNRLGVWGSSPHTVSHRTTGELGAELLIMKISAKQNRVINMSVSAAVQVYCGV